MKPQELSLFSTPTDQPLAARVRPDTLDQFIGQTHLLGPGKILRRLIETDRITSLILWGPPGVGKTTLAHIIANTTGAQYITYSAVTSGIKEIRTVMQQAEHNRIAGQRTILFIDEIHRFNKAQQDAFLPYVEKGSITLIGATTENPSFEINSALLSRCRVFLLHPLTEDELVRLLEQSLRDPRGYGEQHVEVSADLLRVIAASADGDARRALSTLETAVLNTPEVDGVTAITRETLLQITGRKTLLYDKNGEAHYDLISALHKSMRNSDPDAAVYWLARMLEGGEDPLYIARRVTRFASEDIGLADPGALIQAIAAFQACHFIGMPECSVHLTQAVVYMSLAPKSNAIYLAYGAAARDARDRTAEPVPMHLRNAPTRLMKDLGYSDGYQYAHNAPEKLTMMQCLPPGLIGREYYRPGVQGREGKYRDRLQAIKNWKKEHQR